MKFVKKLLLSQKSLYFILIGVGALITIYFWTQTVQALWVNHILSESSPAKIFRWEVEEESDRYFLTAYFSFDSSGQTFQSRTRFSRPFYLNPDSAIHAIQEHLAHPRPMIAWFEKSNPSRSSLEKKVWQGLIFRAALSSVVLIHFFLLRKRLASYSTFEVKRFSKNSSPE